MNWEDWEHNSFTLAHSLRDVLIHGHVCSKVNYERYKKALEWADEFHDEEKATAPTWEHCKENLMQCRPIVIHRREVDCLSQDIFTAIFTIYTMKNMFQLEESDHQILEPVLKHLHKLVPWFKFTE
jgi:hypothetical protein